MSKTPVEKYRPTMQNDVLHSWAADAQAELISLREQLASAERKMDYWRDKCKDQLEAAASAEPQAWIRFCSDGCYEGPLRKIDDIRKRSGAWTPLYTAPPAQSQSTEPQWQPIATAPKDGTRVLLINQDGVVDAAGYIEQWYENPEFVRAAKDGDVYKVVREDIGYWDTDIAYCPTFWMPLPAAPAQTEGE